MAGVGVQRKGRITREQQSKKRQPVFTVVDWAKTNLKFAEWEIDALHRERPNAALLDYYKHYLPGFEYERHFATGVDAIQVNGYTELAIVQEYVTGWY